MQKKIGYLQRKTRVIDNVFLFLSIPYCDLYDVIKPRMQRRAILVSQHGVDTTSCIRQVVSNRLKDISYIESTI